jgi:hypothetical protein
MRLILLAAMVVVLAAAPATLQAQVTNGDFENGANGWSTVIVPTQNPSEPWAVTFPATGGNPDGYGQIMSPFGNSGGTGSLEQSFSCGTANPSGVCMISFDYYLQSVDASSLSGRVKVSVDGNLLFTSPPSDLIDWNTVQVSVPCGDHRIQLTLEVDDGNNGWQAGFDNVTAECMTGSPTVPQSWGHIKAQYE